MVKASNQPEDTSTSIPNFDCSVGTTRDDGHAVWWKAYGVYGTTMPRRRLAVMRQLVCEGERGSTLSDARADNIKNLCPRLWPSGPNCLTRCSCRPERRPHSKSTRCVRSCCCWWASVWLSNMDRQSASVKGDISVNKKSTWVPDLDGFVTTAWDNALAVRRENHRCDRLAVGKCPLPF